MHPLKKKALKIKLLMLLALVGIWLVPVLCFVLIYHSKAAFLWFLLWLLSWIFACVTSVAWLFWTVRVRAEKYVCGEREIWIYVGLFRWEFFADGSALEMKNEMTLLGRKATYIFENGDILVARLSVFKGVKLFFNGERLRKERKFAKSL